MSFDISSIMGSVNSAIKEKMTGMFNTMRNFAIQMCINDIRMQQESDYAPDVQNAMENSMELVQEDDTHFHIVVHLPDTIDKKIRDLVEFCFHTAKQYAFG